MSPRGDSLEQVAAEVRTCTRCRLAASRTHAVPGHGNPRAALVLVAEAPGAKEDANGLPFQGLSGRFLDRSLSGLGVERSDIFITATNKCRPPRNRVPKRDEIAACAGYLDRQLALVGPRVVLAMGATALTRLHPELPAGPVRLADHRVAPIPLGPDRALLVTYHPAAAMRFPDKRQPFLDDLAAACRLADLVT